MPADEPISWSWLGRVGYEGALVRQREHRERVLAGEAPAALWLLEHDPVYTVGRRDAGVRAAALPHPLHHTERGGLATWHGPGQLVGYVIVDVAARGGSVRGTVNALQEGVIRWLGDHGVEARCRGGFPGVWVGPDKICAVGLHFRRGVSMHGFALNLDPDLRAFDAIVPCGIVDGGVTSLARIAGRAPTPAEAATQVGPSVVAALLASFVRPSGSPAPTREVCAVDD